MGSCSCGDCIWCKPGAASEPMIKKYQEQKVVDHQEQVDPTPNNLPYIKDLVISDMGYRAELGKARYNTYLQPHNGRDVLRDTYEELLDACQYIRQLLYERDGK
jgi:hypothetical protein